MGHDSFSLFASVKAVRGLLRQKIDAGAAQAKDELEAGLQEIEALWEQLHDQSLELARERQRYSEFFEYAPDAYLVTDPDGNIREANRAAAELLRARAAALEGKPILVYVADASRADFRTHLVRASAQPDGEVSAWRGTLQPPGSEPLDAHFRVRTLPVADRGLAALCWLVRPHA